MNVNAKMTKSQQQQVEALHKANNVTHVTQCGNGRVRVSMCENPEDITSFRWSLFVGKRGKIFEEEHSNF